MPIYEYQCSACEHEFELIQKFSDPLVTECPECEGEGTVAKKLSVSAFILNGSGWYNDGYSGKKNGKEAKNKDGKNGGSEGKADSSASPEGKSESSAGSEGSSASAASCGHGGCGHCAA